MNDFLIWEINKMPFFYKQIIFNIKMDNFQKLDYINKNYIYYKHNVNYIKKF